MSKALDHNNEVLVGDVWREGGVLYTILCNYKSIDLDISYLVGIGCPFELTKEIILNNFDLLHRNAKKCEECVIGYRSDWKGDTGDYEIVEITELDDISTMEVSCDHCPKCGNKIEVER